MKPASARLPVSAISRCRPTRDSISPHSSPVRPSFQRIAGRSTTPSLVEHDEAVHLAREADRPLRQPREHGLGGAPPVLGLLLGPAGLRRRERVGLLGAREHVAVRVDRDALDAGRADVDPDERSGHGTPRSRSLRRAYGSCPLPAPAKPAPSLLGASVEPTAHARSRRRRSRHLRSWEPPSSLRLIPAPGAGEAGTFALGSLRRAYGSCPLPAPAKPALRSWEPPSSLRLMPAPGAGEAGTFALGSLRRAYGSSIRASSTRFPNGSRQVNRGRPDKLGAVTGLDACGLEPTAQPGQILDGEAEVRLVRSRLVEEHQVQLEITADAEPDEPRRVELRQHVPLLQSEEPAVEGASTLGAIQWNRDRDVLEPHAPGLSLTRRAPRTRARRRAPRPSRPAPRAAPARRSSPRSRR